MGDRTNQPNEMDVAVNISMSNIEESIKIKLKDRTKHGEKSGSRYEQRNG